MATTFTFGGTDITNVATTGTKIIVSNVYRPLRKPVTRHKVEIPGRPGAWDFGGGVERDYNISVDLTITAAKTTQIMPCAEAIDTALNGKKVLTFSDNPTTKYSGQIFSGIDLTPELPGNVARATLIFECSADLNIILKPPVATAAVTGLAPDLTVVVTT